jgi:hypothetical protein
MKKALVLLLRLFSVVGQFHHGFEFVMAPSSLQLFIENNFAGRGQLRFPEDLLLHGLVLVGCVLCVDFQHLLLKFIRQLSS